MADTLVIGGTRNLGPDLVLALTERGDRVTVVNRGLASGSVPAEVERLRADRSDPAALKAAIGRRQFDLVVDTTLYNGRDAQAIVGLLSGCAGRYVVWSTGQVYLVRTGLVRPFTESDYDGPLMPEPPEEHVGDNENWAYGVDKRAAEDVLHEAHAAQGFPYLALRMPMINSARDHYGRLAGYVHRLLDGGPILIPDDQDRLVLRHVYGGDVVTATLRAGAPDVPTGSRLNISQDESLSLEAMLAPVGVALGAPVRLVRRPRAELDRHGLLPACSPWSGSWMSALANDRSKAVLGMRYTAVADYLPPLIEAARRASADLRSRDLELRLAR